MNQGKLAENYIHELSFNSYLRYWCYPNPEDENGNKKEICDLLILCGEICIIISVKFYRHNGDYERYKNNVIKKSTKQIHGAERKLFDSGRIIKIKHPDRNVEDFEKEKYKKIYRITINLGDQFEYYEFIDKIQNKGTINIFNRETFEHIVKELDTLSDLVEYLEARENLLNSKSSIKLHGSESDLLAIFLLNNRKFPQTNNSDIVYNFNGAWESYNNNNTHVQEKRLANKSSYFIDHIIENNILKHDWGPTLANELIKKNRIERRILADNMFELIIRHENENGIIARRHIVEGEIMYLFIYYPPEMSILETDKLLEVAGKIYMYKTNFICKKIIILAATKNLMQWKYSLMVQNEDMNEEAKKYLDKLCDDYGWFKNMITNQTEYKEYPNEPDIPILPYKLVKNKNK